MTSLCCSIYATAFLRGRVELARDYPGAGDVLASCLLLGGVEVRIATGATEALMFAQAWSHTC
jgi:hypothetical protein